MNPTGALISRKQFLDLVPISDSSERRKRKQGGDDWPPHLLIGKKVFYRQAAVDAWFDRQAAVDAWFDRQEAICQTDDATTSSAVADHRRIHPQPLLLDLPTTAPSC